MTSLTRTFARAAAVAALGIWMSASAAMAGHPVPLKGAIVIVPAGPQTIAFPYATQTRLIAGELAPLGPTTGFIIQTVNLTDLSFTGTFTLYATDGSSLSGTATGTLTPTSDPNAFAVDEEAVFTGGTGRFAGATGSAHGVGQAYQDTGVAVETFDGTISLPGK